MQGSSTATKLAGPDAGAPDETLSVLVEESHSGSPSRLRSVASGDSPVSRDATAANRSGGAPRTILDVVDESRSALVRALEDASGTLARLSASSPVVVTDAFVVRATLERRSRAAVLSTIDARRAVLTTRNADGAVASWLVDDDTILARLPSGEGTRLGGGIVATANDGERALLVACERGSDRHGAILALSLDLSTLDACDGRPATWFGGGRSRARTHRHDLGLVREPSGARHPRAASSRAGGSAADVAVPPGMSRTDAARLDAERRTLAQRRSGSGRDGPGPADAFLSARALLDARAFLAAASERFLEGRCGATTVLDASPVLYEVLVRYHGVSHVTRAAWTVASDDRTGAPSREA